MYKYIMLTVLIVWGVVSAYPQNNAGAFLDAAINPRVSSMGRSTVASAGGFESIYINPAGLSRVSEVEMAVMGYHSFETEYWNGGFTIPMSIANFGISYRTAKVPTIKSTQYNAATGRVVDTGATFSYEASALYLTSAIGLSHGVYIGSNVKFVQVGLQDKSGLGTGLDVGVLYAPKNPLSFGLVAQNIVAPEIKWNTDAGTVNKMPLIMSLGASYRFLHDSVLTSVSVQKKENRDSTYHAGVRYWISDMLPLSVGYDNGDMSIGIGLYLNVLQSDNANAIKLDYSLTFLENKDNLPIDNVTRFSVGFQWKVPEPKPEEKKISDEIKKSIDFEWPENL